MRKRPKTPTRIERKQKYIHKKYDILHKKLHCKNLNMPVNIIDTDILNEYDINKLDSIKKQILFLIQLID
jgi:hypothetical protein